MNINKARNELGSKKYYKILVYWGYNVCDLPFENVFGHYRTRLVLVKLTDDDR